MDDRGFTLVETLVAMVVLAIGLLAVSQMTITYVRANTFNHEASEATLLAEEKMEQLRRWGTTDQPGNFQVFGFNYFISTDTTYTTLADGTVVDGLLSGGSGGAAATNSAGTTYEVLTPSGAGTFGSGLQYVGSDTVPLSTGATVARTWSVEPITLRGRTDFARTTVTATWTGRAGQVRDIRLESLFNRR